MNFVPVSRLRLTHHRREVDCLLTTLNYVNIHFTSSISSEPIPDAFIANGTSSTADYLLRAFYNIAGYGQLHSPGISRTRHSLRLSSLYEGFTSSGYLNRGGDVALVP
ncbi:hypothetical protein NXS19_011126 [Fusarium pseudograminearum]|nr:hypothetical protein NXS19_011126 [Fusarium pseudograminearum]